MAHQNYAQPPPDGSPATWPSPRAAAARLSRHASRPPSLPDPSRAPTWPHTILPYPSLSDGRVYAPPFPPPRRCLPLGRRRAGARGRASHSRAASAAWREAPASAAGPAGAMRRGGVRGKGGALTDPAGRGKARGRSPERKEKGAEAAVGAVFEHK